MFRDLLAVVSEGVGGDVQKEVLRAYAITLVGGLPGVQCCEDWGRALVALAVVRLYGPGETAALLGSGWVRDVAFGEIAFRMNADPARDFADVERRVDNFSLGVRPKQLFHFQKKPDQYLARIRAFAGRLAETNEEIREHVLRTVEEQIKGREGRFFEKIPIDRLRTYDVTTIRDVAGHFLQWDPVVEGLEKNDERAVALADRTLRKALGVNPDNLNARGDKVNEAWLRVKWWDPWSGYCYESPLDAWLITVARNWQRDEEGQHFPFVEWINQAEDDVKSRDFRDDGPTPEDLVVRRDLGDQWETLATFIESTFDDEANRILARIFASGDFHELSDDALVRLLKQRTAYSYTVEMVRMTRFCFNKRMEALCGRPVSGSRDLPTRYRLKALNDNLPHDGTPRFGRGMLACCVLRDGAFRDHWFVVARNWMCELKSLEQLEMSYKRWTSPEMASGVSEVRSLARLSGIAFAQETSWYLVVGEERDAEDVAGRFDTEYQLAVRKLSARIEKLNRGGRVFHG